MMMMMMMMIIMVASAQACGHARVCVRVDERVCTRGLCVWMSSSTAPSSAPVTAAGAAAAAQVDRGSA